MRQQQKGETEATGTRVDRTNRRGRETWKSGNKVRARVQGCCKRLNVICIKYM